MPNPARILGTLLLFAACAAAGVAAMWLPWHFAREADPKVAANFVDGMQPISLAWIGLIGLVAGFAGPRLWWLWGPATMVGMVLKIPIDWMSDPTSHNLFPFEVAIYGIISLPAMLAAFVASRFRKRPDEAAPTSPEQAPRP